jgi:hypothetical protein
MNKYISRKLTKRKNDKKRKTIKKNYRNKSIRNKRGGFLFDSNFNIFGMDFSKQTGQKRYNWTTGKWDDYVCYGVGPLKGCKVVPAK